MKPRSLSVVGIATLTLAAFAGPAQAQRLDSLHNAWILPYPTTPQVPISAVVAETARRAPGSSLNSPIAFGAEWGTVYAGAGLQWRVRYLPHNPDDATGAGGMDGAVVAGFGLGNARKLVAFDISVISLGTARSFGRFAFSGKVHRHLPGRAAVAAGVEHGLVIGPTDSRRSLFGVASKQFSLRDSPDDFFSSLTASLGLGTGRFIPEGDYLSGENGVNVFGSVGLRIAEPVGVVADWTGQDLVLAASLVPFKRIPLVISTGFADVLGTAGDGARFVAGAGMGLHVPSYISRR